MIIFPKTLKELQALIDDEVQESLYLDYKEARAVGKHSKQKADFGKDVSAFANSDGGVLIYGIQEKGHLPLAITGIDHSQFSREFIEQTIRTNISQPSPNFTVLQIPIDEKESAFVVKVEKSYGTPHQCKEDKKFYKRYNFESVPMENYEIDDVRKRQVAVPSLINIRAIIESFVIHLVIENTGNHVATDVKFEIPVELDSWVAKYKATLFKTGIKYFPPKQNYDFFYGVANSVIHGSEMPSQFEIIVSYKHPLYSQKITECFGIDLASYSGSYVGKSESAQQMETIRKAINDLTDQVKKINSNFNDLTNIANSSGLNLSFTTLRNIKNILEKNEIAKINPIGHNYLFFMELLGLHWRIAHELEDFFRQNNKSDGLNEIKGIDDETVKKIKNLFILDSKEIEN
jgi:Putative DNA-binding domain